MGGDEILMRLDEIWLFIIFSVGSQFFSEIPAFLMKFVFPIFRRMKHELERIHCFS